MKFYGVLKAHGKKSPKRWGSQKLLLHGMMFKRREKPKELSAAFVKVTGLDKPEIFGPVQRSLLQNHGLVVTRLGTNIVFDRFEAKKSKETVDAKEIKGMVKGIRKLAGLKVAG